jgi:hypothetical protein
LGNSLDQISVFAFLETLDARTVPFVKLDLRNTGNQLVLSFDSVNGVSYGIEGRTTLTSPPSILTTVTGTGQRLDVAVPVDTPSQFLGLSAP